MVSTTEGHGDGRGEILYNVEKGTIQFDDSRFASFKGEINIDFVGQHVAFTGRKVSGPIRTEELRDGPPSQEWANYSGGLLTSVLELDAGWRR